MKTPAYYRARTAVIEAWLIRPEQPDEIIVDNDVRLLRNGFIPHYLQPEIDAWIERKLQNDGYTDDPLSFTELTSFNTWFAMHPEKIAGQEYATTSLHFPIMIRGTQENIIETIRAGMFAISPVKIKAGLLLEKLRKLQTDEP